MDEGCENQRTRRKIPNLRFNYVVQNLTVHQMKEFTEFASGKCDITNSPSYLACNVILMI